MSQVVAHTFVKWIFEIAKMSNDNTCQINDKDLVDSFEFYPVIPSLRL